MSVNSTKKRKSTVLPRSTVDYLKNWMMSPDHIAHPYPTEKEKLEIMSATGIELKQLTNWFVNNRKRFWKPRVEARLQQQRQAQKVASLATSTQSIGSINSDYHCQQPIMVLNNTLNMINPTRSESRVHHLKEPQHSFQIITNQQTFAPPCPSGEADNSNSQVVSMGSVSYSSDSDSASLSHLSHDGDEQVIFTNVDTLVHSPKVGRTPLRKRRVVLDNACVVSDESVAESDHKIEDCSRNVISPQNEVVRPSIFTMKRSRSKSDLLSYSSETKTIFLRPRALTFENRTIGPREMSPKRKCLQDWQSACQNARHGYDASLPSLEEATNLFGYS